METTALIISDQLQDLNRMKNWFPKGVTVKGINGLTALSSALLSECPSLIVMRTHGYDEFFTVYEAVRTTPQTENTPLILIAEVAIGDALKENVLLKNTTIMGSSVTDGYMMKIIGDTMIAHRKPAT